MGLASAVGLLVVGFVILIKGADFLVDGASAVAKRFNISDMIIGLTIVSFGTSAPELVVSAGAAIKGESALILGNVLGSNIYNICLILGAAGLIYPLSVQTATLKKELPFSAFIAFLVLLLANDMMLFGSESNLLTKVDGVVLLVFFGGFMYYIYASAKNSNESLLEEEIVLMPLSKSAIYVIGGLVALVLGGNLVVDNAKFLAVQLGIEDRIIALTVVAIGTSLPELATSVVAAMKKNCDIAVGNVVGSNIFNILFVLGVSTVVSPAPIPYSLASNLDIYVVLGVTALLAIFLIMGAKGTAEGGSKTYQLERWQSSILLTIAVGYTVFLLLG